MNTIHQPATAAPALSLTSPAGYSRADIHMHTNLGDGWSSPAQVIEQATKKGLRLIAVTDHDHVEGAKRVAELLERQQSQLQMITGVEVSTRRDICSACL